MKNTKDKGIKRERGWGGRYKVEPKNGWGKSEIGHNSKRKRKKKRDNNKNR
jgi:hypothetical protein